MKVAEQGGGQLTVEVDLGLYSEAAVFKWLYWCGARFDAQVERASDGNSLTVVLSPLASDGASVDWATLTGQLQRSLIDFQTRQLVAEETKVIRELLVAKALDAMDPFPLPPPGDLSDPVGFSPTDFDEPQGE